MKKLDGLNPISNLKIKTKLVSIILSVTLFMLLIVFTTIIIYERKTQKDALEREMKTIAELSKNILSGPMVFAEYEIDDTLASIFKGIDAIKHVYLLDEPTDDSSETAPYFFPPKNTKTTYYNKKLIETLKNEIIKTPSDKKLISKIVITRETNFFLIYQPIVSKDQYRGFLAFRVSFEELDKRIANFIKLMLFFVLGLSVMSIIIANKLQAIISKPVLDLVYVTKEVSEHGNYDIRVEKKSNDEIGSLYDAYNQMMEQIHIRDEQRNRVKNELRSSQFFLSSVIDSMPSLLITIEKDSQSQQITQWNKTAASITGIPPEQAVGKNLWKLVPDIIDLQQYIQELSTSKQSFEFYKKSIKIKGNQYYFNGSIFSPAETNNIVIMLNDVTDIEQKERQLRQSQKMETVGNLAGGLAHDFNNVLGGIIGTISLYKYKMAKSKTITEKETGKYFTTIEEAANRASDMVQHLLSLTRKKELSVTPTDLNATIRSIIKICKNTFDKSIEIVTVYYKEKAISNVDPTQIEQALLNLCINASHAMTIMRKEGERYGGTLHISLKKFKADKFFNQLHPETEEQDYWNISVSDTGVGMDQKTMAKIFDPFFTTKGEGKGTGLGLAMVYNIIKQHKGVIDVYSQDGIGSNFHIYLPVLKGDIDELPSNKEEDIKHGHGLILVVDDEEVMRQTAQSILTESGYEVITAENGLQGLEIFKENKDKISLVLLDMVMPKMSGKQTFLEMINMDKNVKVLLVSGFKQDQRVESILDMGVKGFLQKPYTMAALANTIHTILNQE